MPVSERLKALVDRMPDPDGRGMLTENIDIGSIEKAVAEIHQGGGQSIVGLVEMMGQPGSAEDVKPHYVLHCLANHVLVLNDEKSHRELSRTLAGELAGDHSNYVKAFLCQELQWAGGREATTALGQLLLNEDLVEPATMALVAIRDGAAEQFRAALREAEGKCRLNVIQGLGAVEDGKSSDALRAALSDPDPEIRLAAGWSLARIGDPGSVDALVQAAEVDPGWERIQAAKHCFVLAEKLGAAGRRDLAAKIYVYLRDSRGDPSEQYIRQAAQKALEAA